MPMLSFGGKMACSQFPYQHLHLSRESDNNHLEEDKPHKGRDRRNGKRECKLFQKIADKSYQDQDST